MMFIWKKKIEEGFKDFPRSVLCFVVSVVDSHIASTWQKDFTPKDGLSAVQLVLYIVIHKGPRFLAWSHQCLTVRDGAHWNRSSQSLMVAWGNTGLWVITWKPLCSHRTKMVGVVLKWYTNPWKKYYGIFSVLTGFGSYYSLSFVLNRIGSSY